MFVKAVEAVSPPPLIDKNGAPVTSSSPPHNSCTDTASTMVAAWITSTRFFEGFASQTRALAHK